MNLIGRHDSSHAHTHVPQHTWRLRGLLGIFVVLFAIIVIRLWSLQVLSYERYSDQATTQHAQTQTLHAKRGTIFFANNDSLYPAAVNRQYYLAYISPRDVPQEQQEDVIAQLHTLFDVDQNILQKKLAKRHDAYEVLKHKITQEERDRLKEKTIPGLYFLPEFGRFYPADTLGAHVLGFVGSDGEEVKGRYGIEAFFEERLRGSSGFVKRETNARGGWLGIGKHIVAPEHDGTSFVLTIDYNVQEAIEKILTEDVKKYDAEAGSAIVVNPKTGAIIAMALVPTFSPNHYGSEKDGHVFRNTLVSDAYEPGSVFKTFTIAMGLDQGKITPQSTYVDTGSVAIGGYHIKNAEEKVYGLQTMTQVLEESINTGVIHVEKLLGNKKFKEYTERFGFGKKTGISLPAEARGNIQNLENIKKSIEFYTASFGQGITVTPIQLVMAYATFANGGTLYAPQIVAKSIDANGEEKIYEPQVIHRVVSDDVSKQISTMLEKVVTGGHAKLATVPGYRVGGKTGTAQVVDPETGKYATDRKNATFVGYGPLDDPQFVILVKYDNPRAVKWSATSAAPTFGRIAQFLFDYYNIPPTEQN